MQPTGERQSWQSALILLSNTVVFLALIATLYFAQMILIPFVLAIILTFLLSPCVRLLQRFKLGRTPAVLLVTAMVSLVLAGSVWMITVEVKSLADELPNYSDNLKGKIRHVRSMGQGSTFGRLEKMGSEIINEWHLKPGAPRKIPFGYVEESEPDPSDEETAPVVVAQPLPQVWAGEFRGWLSPAFTNLGHVALALVLAVFMLHKREALRNRFLRLLGDDPMTTATKAVDDASQRIGRYLLMQFVVNVSYGLAWGTGLYIIGLNYFIFWAFLAAGLRYIPYLGASVAALLPIALSVAQFEGWWPTLFIVMLLFVIELIVNNFLEPLLYGRSIGVSAVALLICSAIWAFLWGPIGLILAAPLTVCLIVVGEQVPRLNFLVLLLGDLPALDANVRFYQRLLARDSAEANSVISEQLETQPVAHVFQEVVLPALLYAKRERERDALTEEDESEVLDAIREILDRPEFSVSDRETEQRANKLGQRFRILAYPAYDEEDFLALELLAKTLDPDKWDMQILAPDTLVSELLDEAVKEPPALIVIGSLPPGGITQTRYATRKLLERNGDARILIGRWGMLAPIEESLQSLSSTGVVSSGTTLLESLNQINTWYPILADEERIRSRAPEQELVYVAE